MSFTVVLSKDAVQNTRDAYLYYEQIQEGLGERLLTILEKQYGKLEEHPQHYSIIGPASEIRSLSVPYFPYSIIFTIIGQTVLIIDVFNTHRDNKNFINEPL